MLRRLLPAPDGGEGRLRFGLRLLAVVVCAAALLQAIRPAVYSTRTGVRTVRDLGSGHEFREQLEYIGAELARQVPAGTRVVVADTTDWRFRITELATLHGIVVVAGLPAALEVSLAWDRSAPHGVRVVTRKPAAA
ncbi:hypothetical protein [Dactylosporangium sp. CA-233914]|uniref:hypothetical protein n=1 Tax=Dactylosporangium sp. CA-233914 TaxID=3239934 RepID=UPI003D8A8F28